MAASAFFFALSQQQDSFPRQLLLSWFGLGYSYGENMPETRKTICAGGQIMKKFKRQHRMMARALLTAMLLLLLTGAAKPTGDQKIDWQFTANGTSLNQKKTGFRVGKDGSVTLWSSGGKLLPQAPDEIAFAYTSIPADRNFVLSAEMTIDKWTYSNGQEGFGLLAADRVAPHGEKTLFWNNVYRLGVQKVEYPAPDSIGTISMKQGIGAYEKVGVTPENLEKLTRLDTQTVNSLTFGMSPLEESCRTLGPGTYNLIGNRENPADTDVDDLLVTLRLRLEKNNTGYYLTYINEDGHAATKKYYDPSALEQLDPEYVYVGLFCTRNATVTFRNLSLTTSDRSTDPPAEERPAEYEDLYTRILSPGWSNMPEYALCFHANVPGVLSVEDAQGRAVLGNVPLEADGLFRGTLPLCVGTNQFRLHFTPESGSHPGGEVWRVLRSYEEVTLPLQVEYRLLGDTVIHVAPGGSDRGDGTEDRPVDIVTALRFAAPGQTILLRGGTYTLGETLCAATSGTEQKPILLKGVGGERPVLDFGGVGGGVLLLGDHWELSGIDVTHSADYTPGIQLCGSFCRLYDIFTYENGNTGVLICALNRVTLHPGNAEYYTDGIENWLPWPHDDTVKGCVSYANADQGWEDADGFAAKMCCGAGILFEDCLAYNNADDGWDLFAKLEYGALGPVTIRHCAAFANGYGPNREERGNGNGFKLGGSGISGRHQLINSFAFDNRTAGITANSNPEVEIYRCIAYENGGKNLSLSSQNRPDTDFLVEGLLSFRSGSGSDDTVSGKGSQSAARLRQPGNFYWIKNKSANSTGTKLSGSWFCSLRIPAADPADLRAVGESLRSPDGTLDMGDFLALSDEGLKTIKKLGVSFDLDD